MIWRPIETAPKDGTEILAYTDYEQSYHVAMFDDWSDGYPNDEASWTDGQYDIAPTHWMPLPKFTEASQ